MSFQNPIRCRETACNSAEEEETGHRMETPRRGEEETFAIVEAVEHFKLHPTSMSYKYKVFDHLELLGMGIWLHTHSIIITDVSPDLGELAESLVR
jgi:hypothetical protein